MTIRRSLRSEAPGGGSVGARAVGPGITDDAITIGIGWFNLGAAEGTLAPGQENGGSGRDNRGRADAVVQWINDHGGIAGRRIEPIYHEFPISDVPTASGRGQREQAMCSDFTEDHQAFAAIPIVATEGVFYQCAAEHNLVTVGINVANAPVDATWFEEIGHIWYSPAGFTADRRDTMLVDQLQQRGFFPPGAKVGVIVWDSPAARRSAERSLEPALQALGADVVAREFYGDIAHSWDTAVLRFASAGVTHVVWGATACPIACTDGFMRAAEGQRYRPFEGIASDNGITDAAELSPEAQRDRIVAISWRPGDVDATEYQASTSPANDNDAICRELARGDDSPNDLNRYCDALFFIKAALEAAPELTWQGFRQAVESPGFQYPPVDGFATAYTSGRHDGANAVRDLQYDPACACMRYTSPLRQVP
jgi:ABC-type branched-subunit amino acid transport system substrate-binding protein